MSNLSRFVPFMELLEKVPITEHIGNIIRKDSTLKSFVIPSNKLLLFTAICINNRDGPIIGLLNYLELNLEDEIMTVSFEDGEDHKIPLDDLICMKFFSNQEAMMFIKSIIEPTQNDSQSRGDQFKCPTKKFRPTVVRK